MRIEVSDPSAQTVDVGITINGEQQASQRVNVGEPQMISRLSQAFEHGDFVLYQQYIQPLKEAVSSAHFEVLVRMRGDNGELVTGTLNDYAIPRAWAWFQGTLEGLMGFVRQLPAMFISTLRSLEVVDMARSLAVLTRHVG